MNGLAIDLAILIEYRGGYLQDLQDRLQAQVQDSLSSVRGDRRGGIFLIRRRLR